MEEDFIKSFGNRKLFALATPKVPRLTEPKVMELLRQDRFFCFMEIQFWGRTYIQKVLLKRECGSIYIVDDFTSFRQMIKPEGIYKEFAVDRKYQDDLFRKTVRVEVSASWKNISLLNSRYNHEAMSVKFVTDNKEWDEFLAKTNDQNGLYVENARDSYIFPLNLGTMERAWVVKHFPEDAAILLDAYGMDYFKQANQYLQNEREEEERLSNN